jgi:hypothetical protein
MRQYFRAQFFGQISPRLLSFPGSAYDWWLFGAWDLQIGD